MLTVACGAVATPTPRSSCVRHTIHVQVMKLNIGPDLTLVWTSKKTNKHRHALYDDESITTSVSCKAVVMAWPAAMNSNIRPALYMQKKAED